MSSTVPDGDRVFLDTNILVYCADNGDPDRQQLCRQFVHRLRSQHRAVISTQVLQEFYVVATRKAGVDSLSAKAICGNLRHMPSVTVTADLIEQAIDCHLSDQLSFWDALIVVSARSAGCAFLLSEDLNPGQTIRGLRIVEPAGAATLLSLEE